MRRISARFETFWFKRVMPLFMFGALILLFVLLVTKPPPDLPPWFGIPFTLFGFVIAYYAMKELVFDLVDDVLDVGDALIIKNSNFFGNNRQEERIALTDIVEVSYSLPQYVTLVLRRQSVFGARIKFVYPRRFLPFLRNREIDALVERVNALKRG
jgi:hypothetical protein